MVSIITHGNNKDCPAVAAGATHCPGHEDTHEFETMKMIFRAAASTAAEKIRDDEIDAVTNGNGFPTIESMVGVIYTALYAEFRKRFPREE
jgi:hypothetical protein